MTNQAPKSFTKDDFLTAAKLAAQLKMDKDIVYAEMVKHYKRATPIKYKSHGNSTVVSQMIISDRGSGSIAKKTRILRLNPHATQAFIEILQNKLGNSL